MHVDVVGAGPAGLMAAEVLAEAGHLVRVYDHRRSPARKFVLAGRGGLNITHSEPLETFLDRYGPERHRLEPAIRAFSPDDVRAWCARMGHPTYVGSSGRVFPVEMRAVPLLRSWLRRLAATGVDLRTDHRWTGWSESGSLCFDQSGATSTSDPDAVVLALGGASWPGVGSDGTWTTLLAERGVTVDELVPANVGVHIAWSSHLVDRFAGTPLKNVAVTIDDAVVRGEPVVTADGLEGGPVYALGRCIRERLTAGPVTIAVDLFPDLGPDDLERRLDRPLPRGTSVASRLRRCGFSPVASSLLREVSGNDIPDDAAEIARLAKALPLEVTATAGLDRAISTAGGVAWSEVDSDFRLVRMPSVAVVGEMLDWEAPTGGYLLQACLSTARWAARSLCERGLPPSDRGAHDAI